MLGLFGVVGPLLRRERPAGLLRLVRDMRVVDRSRCSRRREKQGDNENVECVLNG
jgi:hypothetical protein